MPEVCLLVSSFEQIEGPSINIALEPLTFTLR